MIAERPFIPETPIAPPPPIVVSVQRRPFRVVWQQHWMLYVFLVPALLALILFHFYPLWGISIAFLDYSPARGINASDYVGLANFERFMTMRGAFGVLRNTVLIAIGKIIIGQSAAIMFALMLNEVRVTYLKRLIQTTTTFPHFLSWVIIGGVMFDILSVGGPLNSIIKSLGLQPIKFLGRASIFPWTLILTQTWKEFGFGSIIYLAALTGISQELYEAAAVDGAGRFARVWHISIPSITPTIVLMSCLALGGILNAGFEQVLVLYNPIVYSTGDILDTWVYRVGLLNREYGLGAAVGLFKSIIGFFLIALSYWLADRLANYRIF